MIRVPTFTKTEVVKRTLDSLPKGIREKLGEVDFWFEIDPIYAGAHPFEDASLGRSNRNTSHALWSDYAPDDRASIFLLDGDEMDVEIILHEIGHILDDRLDCDRPEFTPLDSYAALDRFEAFATAFQSYYTTEGDDKEYFHTREQVLAKCPEAAAFFQSLEASAW